MSVEPGPECDNMQLVQLADVLQELGRPGPHPGVVPGRLWSIQLKQTSTFIIHESTIAATGDDKPESDGRF